MYSKNDFKKSALRSAVLLALGANGAILTPGIGNVWASQEACTAETLADLTTDSANFTMLNALGGTVGGTNNVSAQWDGTVFTSSSDYTGPGSRANLTLSSTTAFFGHTWTAHDIQVFAPGSYSFDVTLGGGATETGTLNVTVPNGKLGMHMLFNWNGNNNIDVFVVADRNSVFGSGIARSSQFTVYGGNNCDNATIKNCLWDGKDFGSAGNPAGNKVWTLASGDGNADGVMGISMPTGGPFAGFNANFNFPFPSVTFVSGTPCNSAIPTLTPSSFTSVTGATGNTQYTASDSITVGGLGTSVSARVNITGGEYSKNGGPWTSADGQAVDGDSFQVRQTSSPNEDGTTTVTTLSIGGVPATFRVTTVDKKPDPFSFTAQNVTGTGVTVESNPITVAGLDTGVTTPISISSTNGTGAYAISTDGGATWSSFSTTPATVKNGDQVKVQLISAFPTAIATLTLGSASNGSAISGDFIVSAVASTSGNNFTMLGAKGDVTGGTNDVVLTWDNQVNSGISDPITPANAHMRLSSPTAFMGHFWTAHHIGVYGPGSYTINVDCTISQWETGTCTPNSNPARNYTFTVGTGQIAAHMLFDWNGTHDIDVVNIWDRNAVFGPGLMYTGPGGSNSRSTVWDFMSTDANASCPGAKDSTGAAINCGTDGINGIPMIDGPFVGFNANFNLRVASSASSGSYTPTVTVQDPSNSPGCSISSVPVKPLARGDWWLVAGFLAWLGAIRMRFRRKTQS
jgi:hypothetical protein